MKLICFMRDVYREISIFEAEFEKVYGLSLNEAMVLCTLKEAGTRSVTSTYIAERTEMTPSHTSKVIRSVEEKGLIRRAIGETDKRQMYFVLTKSGKDKLERMDQEDICVPELLKPIFVNAE